MSLPAPASWRGRDIEVQLLDIEAIGPAPT
jgi:hypothetical protein